MFDLVTLVLELFGYGNWKQILQDSKAARMEIEIEQIQEENEDSEELNSGDIYETVSSKVYFFFS